MFHLFSKTLGQSVVDRSIFKSINNWTGSPNRKFILSNIRKSPKAENMLLKDFLSKIEKKIPLEYACDWDNVGLLVEPCEPFSIQKIMLTNDLTEPVLDEAIQKNANLIISYHPPIFRPFKSITQKNWKERIIAKCLINQIAVYSPHTALDAIEGGINDWLLKPFNCSEIKPIENSLVGSSNLNVSKYSIQLKSHDKKVIEELKDKLPITIQEEFNGFYNIGFDDSLSFILHKLNEYANSIKLISVNLCPKLPLHNEGMGRIGKLSTAMTISQILDKLKEYIELKNLRLSLSHQQSKETLINSIAVCAGSGASLLRNVKADFFITGEMSHHEVLDVVHQGTSVALCEHSNTERGYLKSTLFKYLNDTYDIPIIVSEIDQDPIQII